ncbi:uncharacterized protein [Temnothorax longispinosus]|uniref:uncharacterized protein isoform X3 n=1 Tax=Temnothorax longispinosus TaxID=300112 RepID=UPI003A991646
MASAKKKGPKKVYERFKYTEKDMEEALKAARNGMSISTAAATYNVPKSTLHGRYTCKVPNQRKMGPKSILTEAEEDRLEKWILGKAQVGFPMHPDEVKDAVQRVIEECPRENPFKNNRPGEKWMDLFLKRHPEIRKKNTEIISKARACVTEEGLRQWFAEARAFLEENDVLDILNRPRSIFNGDETGVQTCPKSGLLLGPKSEKNFYVIANGKEKDQCITVLCTFSAAGEAIPPMIVFPYKRIPVHIAQSVPDGWPIGRSDSGWMIHATFYEYVANVFYPWCVGNNVQFPVLYFLDGHKSHISLALRDFCVEHAIILYCLPPNSTHIMQPCDVTIFKPLKAHWKKVVYEHKQQTQKPITKANFALLFKKAFGRLLLKVETIQNGFKTCGLYPFDENAVNYSKCISTRRANLQQMSLKSISTQDFASTKKVIEHVIGPAKAKSFAKMRNAIQGENATDPLFTLWTICTDHVEDIHMSNDEECIPNTLVQAQENVILISDDAILQEVENSISFPFEELTDPNFD